MSGAIVGGLLKAKYPANKISISEPNENRRKELETLFSGVTITDNNLKAADNSETIVLGVKPNITKKVLTENGLSDLLNEQSSILVSLVAGVKVDSMKKWLTNYEKLKIVRCMPNTPALVGQGALGFYYENEDQGLRNKVESIMGSIAGEGGMVWVTRENLMDSITAISGSGPAYFFYMLECMEKEGVRLGLEPLQARRLATVTALGASKMVLNQCFDGEVDPKELRRRVTSPNGTTYAAIQQLIKDDFETVIKNTLNACSERSKEIGIEMENQN
ncbi:pyrroline-5-carboxylate reductase [Neoconidiobolus thromboides FSU 785]|nr:pyrroline-5-carboxylate reductase [Neoconidiobolus thromboides FSU 785]